MLPILKEYFEERDGRELIGDSNYWGIMEGTGEEIESMENAVFVSASGLGEVVVAKFTVSKKRRGLVAESTT